MADLVLPATGAYIRTRVLTVLKGNSLFCNNFIRHEANLHEEE